MKKDKEEECKEIFNQETKLDQLIEKVEPINKKEMLLNENDVNEEDDEISLIESEKSQKQDLNSDQFIVRLP